MATIAFTYDVGTPVGQVRFYAGDTDGEGLNRSGGERTRTDAEILFLLAQNGNDARGAAAELLESRAAEFAQAATLTTQGKLRQDFTARSSKCLEAAKALRQNAGGGLLLSASPPPFSMTAADGSAGTMDDW